MKSFIIRYSTGKWVLSLFVLSSLIYVIMIAYSIPKTAHFAGGMKLLDMMPGGYNFDYVNTLFSSLGSEGRHTYLFLQLPVDMVYPALFAFAYCLLLAWFLKKLNKINGSLIYACYLPLIAGFADYMENLGIITLLNQYPDITSQTVTIVSIFSVIKSSATTLYFLILLVVLIVLGVKMLRKK